MKLLDSVKSFLHLGPRPQICCPAFGEVPVPDSVDFSFAVDEPMKSPLSNKAMCKPERVPGLGRVLSESKSTPMPARGRFYKDALKSGLSVAGPALGLPGVAAIHFGIGASGVEFSAVDSNQSPVPLDGKVIGGDYGELSLELPGGRKIEIDCASVYPKNPPKDQFGNIKTEAFGMPIASSYGVRVKSYLTDSKQGTVDCLITNFDEQGQPVQAGYKRRLPEYRTLEAKYNLKDGVEIFLTQGGTRDGSKAEQNVTITPNGVKNDCVYHSCYEAYPF